MTNTKTTKRALFASVFSLLLCVSMLIGSTFAWFTDTASTGVNKIVAGTLDIQLLDSDDNDLEGATLNFKKAAGAEAEDILWEPGCTYELPEIFVKNNGNLALKYKVVITGINGDAKLNEAIVWTINNAAVGTEYSLAAGAKSEAITISGHMKEEAGNEYQGLSIDGIAIAVYATQDTVEHDSTTDQYDADALDAQGQNVLDLVKAGYEKATNYDEFKTAIAGGKNVVLAADITTDGLNGVTIDSGKDVVIDLNGYTINHTTNTSGYEAFVIVNNGGKLTVNDSAITGAIKANVNSANYGAFALIWNMGEVVINAGTLDFAQEGSAWGYIVDDRPNIWTGSPVDTILTINGGRLNAHGEEAVRVANNNGVHNAENVIFNMNGGTINGWGGIFVQQLNETMEKLVVNLNGGTIDTTNCVFRTYGNYDSITYTSGYSGNVNVIKVADAVKILGANKYRLSTTAGIHDVTVPSTLILA